MLHSTTPHAAMVTVAMETPTLIHWPTNAIGQ